LSDTGVQLLAAGKTITSILLQGRWFCTRENHYNVRDGYISHKTYPPLLNFSAHVP